MIRFFRPLVALVAALAVLLSTGAAASSTADRLAVLTSWTKTSVASYNAWNSARQNQGAWKQYGFDWTTDYCSDSPDQPLGFDFRVACWHHDFGYRNWKAAGKFAANKDRVDSTLYADLKRKCATYRPVTRPGCYSLAWTYYQAVHYFGSFATVTPADLQRAAKANQEALAG
jgi:Prokaryotic phospholipase A2